MEQKIDLTYTITSECFSLRLQQGTRTDFLAHSEPGCTVITCPPTANFEDPALQQWLRKVIQEALRKNAKHYLPHRLQELSQQIGLPFHTVKINSSRGRWGSCSGKKDINLSLYVMLLPRHLIDYVLLHELCHTCEMNHGPQFWTLLDSYTQGKAKMLRAEMRKFTTSF